MKQIEGANYSRFEVFQNSGKDTRVVGSAYLREGDSLITLRLWTMMNEKFYVLLSKQDASKYLVMTREENRNVKNSNKYFWHIVGSGNVDSKNGIVQLNFDLFDRPILMSLQPDRKPTLTLANELEAS
jgi:hypothetical protein